MAARREGPDGARQLVLDHAAVGLLVLDRNGAIVDALGDLGPLTGEPAEAFIGRKAVDVLDGAGAAAVAAPPDEALVAGPDHRFELRLVRGEPGHPTGAVLLAAAFPDHMRVDEALRERDRQAQLMFRQFPGATWVTDRNLRITHFLGKVERRLGIPESKIVGSQVQDIARTRASTDPVTAHHLAALVGTSSGGFRYRLGDRWYMVHVDPLTNDAGAIIGCIGAALDITEFKDAEERVAANEALLALSQELAHVGSWEWDLAHRNLRRSDELFRIYGRPPGAFDTTYESLLSYVHPDDVDRTRAALYVALHHPGTFELDMRIDRPDGAARTIRTSGIVTTDQAGVPQRVAAACLDTTEWTQAAVALRRTVSLLEATIESTADGILVVDRDGKVAAYNKRFMALWRVPERIAAERNDQELLAFVCDQLAEPAGFMREVQALYDTPEAESLDQLRFKDGRVFERYSRPQRVDGAIVGRVWSFRDVTERVQLLRDAVFLADASRLLATLDIDPALDGVAQLLVPALGTDCAIDLFGDAAPRRWFATSRELALRPEIALPGPALAGHSILYEINGNACMSIPLTIRGRVVGAITVVAERERTYAATDVALIEELARRVAVALENAKLYRTVQDEVIAREEFLAVAAHEIRGPLTSIRLAAQTFGKGMASDARLVDVIGREERRLTRFVDDLLDLGRFRAKQLVFSLERVDLAAVVRDVAARMSADLTRSGSSLSIESTAAVVGTWDRVRLDQVVTNLLSNAIKFGRGKPISITLGAHDGRARLAVTDQGVGMRADQVAGIFEPFKRAVPSQHYEGLGLGLYIVRTIVEGLGGEISVRSAPDAGSTFTVELPLDTVR